MFLGPGHFCPHGTPHLNSRVLISRETLSSPSLCQLPPLFPSEVLPPPPQSYPLNPHKSQHLLPGDPLTWPLCDDRQDDQGGLVYSLSKCLGFAPGSARICLQCRRLRFDPWVRKIPWRRKWKPSPVFLPGQSHGQRSLVGYNPWGHKELDRTKQLTHS